MRLCNGVMLLPRDLNEHYAVKEVQGTPFCAQLTLINILITFLNSSQIILNDQFLSTSKQRFSLVKSLLAGSLMLNKVLMFLSTLTGCTLLHISILCEDVKGLHITGYLSKATPGQLKQQ